MSISTLQPTALWSHFADLNAVPRASKKEAQVIQFMVDFGESLNLPTQVDAVGNVIIKKPATTGMENRQTVVLQSHLDMVHQKNADTDFDFATEGIKMVIDGDWVKAAGTTLGADNGIGVAAIMALLAADDIAHPALEALFTIDEETGMTGAKGLVGGLLSGDILLNLDTEDDDELTIGCAGGIDITATGQYQPAYLSTDSQAFKLHLTGLTGGHSGMDIHLGRGNANKLMNRLLLELSNRMDIHIAKIEGGSLRNAIPRESLVELAVSAESAAKLEAFVAEFRQVITAEYQVTDPELKLECEPITTPRAVLDPVMQRQLLRAVYACPNGIYRMSPNIEGLVQTSNNLARVEASNGQYQVLCLTRSSVDTEKLDLVNAIQSSFELMGADVTTSGDYPGWDPKPEAPIIKMMSDLYRELFDGEPHVYACHAGLECGILGLNYPEMDMISFGPNIRGAHSPDEKVQISSVQKFWGYLLATLERVPMR